MKKLQTAKRVSKREQHSQAVEAAMPEVRQLCQKYGRSIVRACVSRIDEYEKKSAEVERLRAEAEALEKRLLDSDGTQRLSA